MENKPPIPDSSGKVTRLLAEWSGGNANALEELFPFVYRELRSLAASAMRRERAGHTLQPTALVHEAYLRLVDQDQVRWKDRQHFLAIAATMMRRILVNHARDRAAAKRGGGLRKVPLEAAETPGGERAVDLVALDEALHDLARTDERLARIVEMRFFGGMSVDDIAGELGVDPRTVKRGWQAARTVLFDRLRDGENDRGEEGR